MMKLVDSVCLSLSVLILACSGEEPQPNSAGNTVGPSTATGSDGTTTSGMATTSPTSGGSPATASNSAGNTATATSGNTMTGNTSDGGTATDSSTGSGGQTTGASAATGAGASGGLQGAGGTTTNGTETTGATDAAGGSTGTTGGTDMPTAVANITPTTAAPAGWESFAATATFTEEGNTVTLVVEATGCPDGLHIAHLHANLECGADGEAAGAHWIPNGEVLDDMQCESGMGTYTHTESTDVWSIGGDPSTDITQHAYMVHALSNAEGAGAKAACGSINAQ